MDQLRLFGGVSLTGEQGPIRGRGAQRRRLALLALLAVERRAVSRDKLIGLLWPESDAEAARHALSESLYVLRKALGEDAVVATGDELRLATDVLWCDVVAFETALDADDPAAAVTLYAGPFLDGFFISEAAEFEQWASLERERLGRRYADALRALALAAEADGNRDGAVAWWRRLATLDPYNARTAVALMRALDQAGDRAAALQHARIHTALLEGEFGAAPDPAVESLARELKEASAGNGSIRTEPAAAPVLPAVAPEPPHTTQAPLPTPASPPIIGPSRRARALLAAAIVGALVITGTALLARGSPQRTASAAGGTKATTAVVVFPFGVRAAPEWAYLGEGLVHMLSTKLDGAAGFHSVDAHTVLRYAERTEGRGLDPVEAAALAKRLAAAAFVLGELVEVRGRMHLTATLYDGAGAEGTRHSVEGPTDSVLALVDRLAAGLIVGRSRSPGERLSRLAGLTTHSLEAYKAYLAGEAEFQAARYPQAVTAFRSAVALDSSFALAHYRLSTAAMWAFEFSLARLEADLAIRSAARLTEHDGAMLSAWYDFLHGRADAAARQYDAILTDYPAEVEARSGLAEVLMHYNPPRGLSAGPAEAHFRMVLDLDPAYGEARYHLLEFAARRRDRAAFDSLLGGVHAGSEQRIAWRAVRAFGWGTEAEIAAVMGDLSRARERQIGIAAGRVAAHLEDFAGGARIATLLLAPERTQDWRAAGAIFLAQLEVAQGHWREGQAQLVSAAAGERGWALELLALDAVAPWLGTPREELVAIRDTVAAWDPTRSAPRLSFFFAAHAEAHAQIRLYVLGLLDGALGDRTSLLERARALESLGRSRALQQLGAGLAGSLRAYAEYRAGNDEEALRQLEANPLGARLELVATSPIHSQALDRYLRAELLRKAGRLDEALEACTSLTEGFFDFTFAAPAHRCMAQIHEARGQRAAARAHYQRFIDLWHAADPRLQPALDSARTRLQAL